MIPDCGHVSNLERPAEVNAAIRRFCLANPPLVSHPQCAEEDSNLHPVIPDQALNLARLPIPPSARVRPALARGARE